MLLPAFEHDPALGLVAFAVAGRAVVMTDADCGRLLASLPADTRLVIAESGGRHVPAVQHQTWGVAGVARLLAGATGQQAVSYRNGDAFDLTPGNLIVQDRRGSFRRERPEPRLPGRASGPSSPGKFA